jgi:serine/threonine protein kinase/Tfp pilus assembly protein PilF
MSDPLHLLALEIFGDLIEAEENWESVLRMRCGEDELLRAEVERLWRDHHSEVNDWLDQPAAELMAAEPIKADAGTVEDAPIPDFQCGRFKLKRRLGRGGQGEVWLAVDSQLGREVALKIVPPNCEADVSVLEKLRFEAEVIGRLEHPSIVSIYESGRDSRQCPFYVMRVFREKTLQSAIDQFHQGSRTQGELRGLLGRFVSVCEAMAYAHQQDVIHLDLKPTNVMLGSFGETLVVDWGIARDIGPKATPISVDTSGQSAIGRDPSFEERIRGTPSYMSPEQARGDSLTPASDIFSLGSVLYCILTGVAPRRTRASDSASTNNQDAGRLLTPEQAIALAIEGRVSKPTSICDGIPRGLEAICVKALSKEIERRYSTALDLAKDVRNWLNDEPLEAWAGSEPLAIWGRRSLSRHQSRVASIGVTTLLALGVIVGVYISKNQELSASYHQLDDRQKKLEVEQTKREQTNRELLQRNEELEREQARRQLALEVGFRLLRGIESGGKWSIDDAYSDILQNGLQLPDNERAAMLPLFQALTDLQQADEQNRYAELITATDLISGSKKVAAQAVAAGKLAAALKNLEIALQHHGQSGLAWLLKAQIRREILNQPAAEVLPDWNRATELLPKSSAVFSGRGWCRLALKQLDEAQLDFQKAAELDAHNEFAQLGLGRLAKMKDDLDAAARHFQAAAELSPRFNTNKLWRLGAHVEASYALWARGLHQLKNRNAKGAFADILLAVQFGQPKDCAVLWENLLILSQSLSSDAAAHAVIETHASKSRFRDRPEFDFARDLLIAVLETQASTCRPQTWHELEQRSASQPTIAIELSDKYRSELSDWSRSDSVDEPIRDAIRELLKILDRR